MIRPKIFFLHNPKAGGTSLRSMFARLSAGSVAPVFAMRPTIIGRVPPAAMPAMIIMREITVAVRLQAERLPSARSLLAAA